MKKKLEQVISSLTPEEGQELAFGLAAHTWARLFGKNDEKAALFRQKAGEGGLALATRVANLLKSLATAHTGGQCANNSLMYWSDFEFEPVHFKVGPVSFRAFKARNGVRSHSTVKIEIRGGETSFAPFPI